MLSGTPQDLARIDLLLQFIVAVAAEQDDFRDRELGPIHLLKYVYLADLAYAERHGGETYTGTAWQFHHFGPWSADVLDRIEPALSAIGVESKHIPSRFSGDTVRYGLHRSESAGVRSRGERELPSSLQFRISRAIYECGADTAFLLHSVYSTLPMLHAAPEEILDFGMVVRESPTEYQTTTDAPPSRTQQKSRQRRLNEIRAEVQARLAKRSRDVERPVAEPRYDDVFTAGTEWLDGLAGQSLSEAKGKLSVSNDVWKSETRRAPEIP